MDACNALCDALCVEPACIDAVGGTDADEALSAAGYVCMQSKESTFMLIIICEDGEREVECVCVCVCVRERERRSSWRHNTEAPCFWVSTNTLRQLHIISILSYISCSHKIRLAAVNGVFLFVFISFALYVCNPYVVCVCVRMRVCVGSQVSLLN
jgi:hypothetical protein